MDAGADGRGLPPQAASTPMMPAYSRYTAAQGGAGAFMPAQAAQAARAARAAQAPQTDWMLLQYCEQLAAQRQSLLRRKRHLLLQRQRRQHQRSRAVASTGAGVAGGEDGGSLQAMQMLLMQSLIQQQQLMQKEILARMGGDAAAGSTRTSRVGMATMAAPPPDDPEGARRESLLGVRPNYAAHYEGASQAASRLALPEPRATGHRLPSAPRVASPSKSNAAGSGPDVTHRNRGASRSMKVYSHALGTAVVAGNHVHEKRSSPERLHRLLRVYTYVVLFCMFLVKDHRNARRRQIKAAASVAPSAGAPWLDVVLDTAADYVGAQKTVTAALATLSRSAISLLKRKTSHGLFGGGGGGDKEAKLAAQITKDLIAAVLVLAPDTASLDALSKFVYDYLQYRDGGDLPESYWWASERALIGDDAMARPTYPVTASRAWLIQLVVGRILVQRVLLGRETAPAPVGVADDFGFGRFVQNIKAVANIAVKCAAHAVSEETGVTVSAAVPAEMREAMLADETVEALLQHRRVVTVIKSSAAALRAWANTYLERNKVANFSGAQ